ncbi:MAG: lamin tail domain-containing protein [Flavobacteriales bacterium]|nr:lamin tail domain-containing protein [Flavobacteriales bacterium]
MGTPERLRIAAVCMLIGPAYWCATDLSAQLVINEVCSANNAVLEAPEGDHPDWVELHNTGSSPIQLHDHYFSDKPSEPALWRLPVMVLDPDAYIVLFSGNSAGRFPFRHRSARRADRALRSRASAGADHGRAGTGLGSFLWR